MNRYTRSFIGGKKKKVSKKKVSKKKNKSLRLTNEEKDLILKRRSSQSRYPSSIFDIFSPLRYGNTYPKFRKYRSNFFELPNQINKEFFELPNKFKSPKSNFYSHSEIKKYSNTNGEKHYFHKTRNEDKNKINIMIDDNGKKRRQTIKKTQNKKLQKLRWN